LIERKRKIERKSKRVRCNNERDASNAREPVEPVECRLVRYELVRYEGANAE